MAANPAIGVFATAASVPPANITSASPYWMVLVARPMALLPEAQAVTSASTGPMRPKLMDTCPAAILAIIIGTAKGLTLEGPLVSMRCTVSSMVPIPPMPVPMMVPTRSGFSALMSSLASSTAILAAATANCTFRSIWRTAFLSPTYFTGSKSFTSPAMRTGKSAASNSVMGPMPDFPAISAFQNSSVPMPTGETTPMPVITTLLFSLKEHLAITMINIYIHGRIKPQKNG